MKNQFKQNKAITLIALVITIIVLLILAGVKIVTLTGDNCLLQKAQTAKEANDEAATLEKVQVEVAGSYGLDGNIDIAELNKNLMNINGLTYNEKPININESNTDAYNVIQNLPTIVKLNGINIEIKSDSRVQKATYITDGLVLRYDGIENTRNGNNPNTTSWEDLSGNENDGIFSNAMVSNQNEITDLSKGYYSPEENGYVFLHNDAYIKSKNNIGISGDANYTVEVVMKPWSDRKNPNYSCFMWSTPVWWGSSNANVSFSTIHGYDRNSKNLYLAYINNNTFSDNSYDILDKKSYLSYRKIKNGIIKNGDKDVAKIDYNGSSIPNTYTGNTTFTPNLVDSPVQIGRDWQYASQNRPFYGSIQSIRIYNRVLTDEEVSLNYASDKERFNIE